MVEINEMNFWLAVIENNSGIIVHAVSQMKWPGIANVIISLVTIHKGDWFGLKYLDQKVVENIDTYLTSNQTKGEPFLLEANEDKSFIGSVVLGQGFSVDEGWAKALIKEKVEYADVLFPYINGQDFNSSYNQRPGRWIINFFDWDIDFCKSKYPVCFKIVEEFVKPQRDKVNKPSYRDNWWMYAEKGRRLYKTIVKNKRILLIPVFAMNHYSLVCIVHLFDRSCYAVVCDSLDKYHYKHEKNFETNIDK